MSIFYLFIFFAVECCSGGIAHCLHLQEPTLCQIKTMWHTGDKGQEEKPMPPQLLRVSDCAGLLKQYELYVCMSTQQCIQQNLANSGADSEN